METKRSRVAEDLAGFYEAALLDLPIAAASRALGAADEKTFKRAGWKAYDAWVRLVNEVTNEVYSNRAVAAAAGGAFEAALRARRVGDALTSALFGNLWPALGVPTAKQVNALRDELTELRERTETRRREETRRERAADESLRLIWNGSEHRSEHRVKEAKNNVAA